MPDSWFYIRDKKKMGPVGRAALQQLALGGQIRPTDMVMQEGAGKWQAAAEVPGLFPSKPATPTAPTSGKPAPAPTQSIRPIVRPQPTAQGTQPRPQPPSSPGVQKPLSAAPPIISRGQGSAQGVQPRPPMHGSSPGAARAPAPPPADQWFYVKDKKKVGPVTAAQLRQLIVGGQLRGSDMVVAAGTTKWQPAGSVPGIFGPPRAPAAPAQPAKPAAAPQPPAAAPLKPAAAAAPKPAPPVPPPAPKPVAVPPVDDEEEDDEEYEDDEYEDDDEGEDDEEDGDEEYEDDDEDEEEVDIHENMERASQFQAAGDFPKAIAEYSQALRAAPDDPKPYNALAWIWATCPDDRIRDGKKAVEYAKQAVMLIPDGKSYYRVKYQETLAAAHAEAGDFTAASAAIDDAIVHASFEDQPRLCRRRGLYHNEQPFRDEPGADDPVVEEESDNELVIAPAPPAKSISFFGKVSRSINKLLHDRNPEDERAFLQAIAAHPDDDAPRLAYAEWLLGHGDPQGEFIRLDIELDEMAGDDPRRDALDERWSTLLDEHAPQWLAGLADIGIQPMISGRLVPGMWYERGLITTVVIEKPDLLPAKAAALFAAAPALRCLRFRCQELDLPGIAKLPQLAQLSVLDLSGAEMKGSGLRALLASPHLTRLTELDLAYNELGDEGAHVLANAPLVGRLTGLNLRSWGFTSRGLDLLVRSPHLARLEHLDLGSNDLDSDALRQLLGARHLAHLKSLGLGTSRFGAEGIRALASSASLRGLEALRLSWCEIGPEGAKALAASPYLQQLTTLDLSGNAIKAEGAKALAASRLLGKLELLDVDSNELGPTGARALAASPYLNQLTELSIGRNEIGDEGVGSLTGSPHFARLSKLSLSENNITTKGAQSLAKARYLANLRELTLFDNRLGLGGAQALATSAALKKLHVLGVSEKAVTAAGKEKLLEHFGEDVVSFQ